MRRIVGLLLAIVFAIAPLLTFAQPVQAATVNLAVASEGTFQDWSITPGGGDFSVLNSDDDDTSYMSTASGGVKQTLNMDDTTATSISAVTIYAKTKCVAAGPQTKLMTRIAGADYYGNVEFLTTSYVTYSKSWTTSPATGTAWTAAEINAAEFGIRNEVASYETRLTYFYVQVTYNPTTVPVLTTAAVTGNGYTAPNYLGTLNGEITSTGGITPDYRGFVWDTSTHADPGNTSPEVTAYSDNWTESGSFAAGTFNHAETSFAGATVYYVRSYAHNSVGWAYGSEVSFTTLSAPTITTSAASAVTISTARLNATVTASGGQLTDVRFAYDNVTRANFALYANTTAWVTDTYDTGNMPYVDIASLTGATTYYFRVQVRNDVASAEGLELTFATANGVLKPTNVAVIPASTTASVSWTKGSGAQYTLARYKVGSYPTTTADGTSAYLGTGNSVSITSLTPGLTYYVSLWGFTGGTYSADYATGLGTTLAYDSPGTGTGNAIEVPADTGTFTQTPSTVKVATVPFHEAVEAVSTAYSTPLNMVWYVIWMVAGLAGGILLYNRAGQGGQASYNLPMTFGAEAIWFGIGASIGLTMMWIVVLFLLVAAGFTMFGNRH